MKKQRPQSRPSPAQATEDRLHQILDLAGVIILIIDTQERIQLINRKGCEVLGYAESDLLGLNWFETCVPEPSRPQMRSLFQAAPADGGGPSQPWIEGPVVNRSGQERLIAWHRATLFGPHGKIEGTLGSGEDITEQRLREDSLKRREAELQAIVDTAVDGIITIDEKGLVQTFNSAATRLFGYQPQEIIGENISKLMPEPDKTHHDQYLANYLGTGSAKIIGIGREVHGKRKDGSVFPLYLSVSETRVPGRRVFTGIVHDLTAFKQMQEQLLQSRHLAMIGEMAATVAHEIKNPLAGIGGAIHVLRDTLEAGDARRDIMGEILDQVRRLDDTVRQLLMLSKPWKPSCQSCDLRALARQVCTFAEEEAQFSHVRFLFEGDEKLVAEVDSSLVQQVLLNLIQNSAQALTDTGRIIFSFRQTREAAEIEITDTGPGVSPEVQDRLFRPFVTTKAQGTGLGLPICKKIMEAHGGSISIVSRAGKGATVSLRFPTRAGK